MAEYSNQDIINAIRGLYQGPNRVTDDSVRKELSEVVSKLEKTFTVEDLSWKAELEAMKSQLQGMLTVQDASALAELEAVKTKLEAIETRLNEPLDTKLTGSNVEEPLHIVEINKNPIINDVRVYQFRVEEGVQESDDLREDRPCIIQDISISSDHYARSFNFRLEGIEGANPYIRVPAIRDSNGFGPLSPAHLVAVGGSFGIFELGLYDKEEDEYFIKTKQPIPAPGGFTFRMPTQGDVNMNAQIVVYYLG